MGKFYHIHFLFKGLYFIFPILHYEMTTQKCRLKAGIGKGEGSYVVLSSVYIIQIDGEDSRGPHNPEIM